MSSERKGFTRGRRSAASLSNISAADVIELQKSASQRKKKLCIEFLTQRATFIAWYSSNALFYVFNILIRLVWMMVGTLFYCYHDDFGWQDGFFQCVNVGMYSMICMMYVTDPTIRLGYWCQCST